MHKNRLYCASCGARKSSVFLDKKGEPKAVCDEAKGGCGANITLFRDEYGKVHPVRVKRITMRCTVCGANCYDDGTKDCDCDAHDYGRVHT